MNNENKLIPDFRQETIQTYTETYTPDGGTEQTATYKIGTAHPIIGGILDKFTWIKTHVAAVWWNKQAGVTLKEKIDTMDESIAQLNGKTQNPYTTLIMDSAHIIDANDLPINSCGYAYNNSINIPSQVVKEGSGLIFTFGYSDLYKAQICVTLESVVYVRRRTESTWTAWREI